jgi:hypothetical protein
VQVTYTAPEPEPEPEPTEAGVVATTSAQAGVAAVAGLATVSSVLSGTPPTSLWAIMQQLQMVIVLVMVDSYTPEDVDTYLEGVSFAMFNFNFIPIVDIPLVDVPVEWMESAQPFDKLETLGLESRSTFVNNISFLFTMVFLAVGHLSLKFLLC